MKNLAVFLGIVMLAAAFAVPAYAMGGGMGGGMMGNWGSGLLDWFQKSRNGNRYSNPREVEKRQMEELDRQHHEDSVYLKYQIQMKEKELDSLLKSKDPDIEKVRAEADQEQRNYELERDKMSPGYQSDNRNAWSSYGAPGPSGGRGMGYGGQMGDYGSGR
jgi:Spy/CpxP family protein refolding chaperone